MRFIELLKGLFAPKQQQNNNSSNGGIPSGYITTEDYKKQLQDGVALGNVQTPPQTLDGVITRQKEQVIPAPVAPQGSYQLGHPKYMEVNKNQGTSTLPVSQPPMNIADAIWAEFPNDATAAATVAFGENGSYDVNALNPWNNNGTTDYGLFQNNSGTFNEMLAKAPFRKQLNAAGINSLQDLLGDARKSAAGARIRGTYGTPRDNNMWNWWYGWQDRGFDPYGYTK